MTRHTGISDGDGKEFTEHALDIHSVTCALCGELADSRKAVSLWPEDYAEFDGYMSEDREVFILEYPNGESHISCFDEAIDQ